MRETKNTIRGILVYPLPNFSNQYHNIVTENLVEGSLNKVCMYVTIV